MYLLKVYFFIYAFWLPFVMQFSSRYKELVTFMDVEHNPTLFYYSLFLTPHQRSIHLYHLYSHVSFPPAPTTKLKFLSMCKDTISLFKRFGMKFSYQSSGETLYCVDLVVWGLWLVNRYRCLDLLHLAIILDDVLITGDQKAARDMGSLMLEKWTVWWCIGWTLPRFFTSTSKGLAVIQIHNKYPPIHFIEY